MGRNAGDTDRRQLGGHPGPGHLPAAQLRLRWRTPSGAWGDAGRLVGALCSTAWGRRLAALIEWALRAHTCCTAGPPAPTSLPTRPPAKVTKKLPFLGDRLLTLKAT